MVYGRNEVESLRPDASLTMSSVRLLASLPDARTHRQHPSNAAQESASSLTMRFKMHSLSVSLSLFHSRAACFSFEDWPDLHEVTSQRERDLAYIEKQSR